MSIDCLPCLFTEKIQRGKVKRKETETWRFETEMEEKMALGF